MKKQFAVRLRQSAALSKSENLVAYRGHSKRKGELSELAFLYKAVSMGFGVAKPYGDSERFDFIVSSGNRLRRVQVKSCYTESYRGYGVRAGGNCKRGPEMYTPHEIDVIVVYVVPEDAWYVIPINALCKRYTLYLHPNGRRRGMYQYEQYREAWIMKAKNKLDVAKSPH
jgi:hypothetical protein